MCITTHIFVWAKKFIEWLLPIATHLATGNGSAFISDWILVIKMSYSAYSVLFPQLITTLVYYPCTAAVALPGLADWSAFPEQVCQTCKVTT